MSKKILVTGGAGFLGSHLCKTLLDQGNEVICLDNFYSGMKENVIELLDNKYFEIIRHDINTPIYLEVDEIYNLACPASPGFYQKDPIHTTKTCVIGSLNMLGLAKRTGAKILQASTSEIYGDPEVSPQNENYNGNVSTFGFRACYDEGKRCAETLFYDYNKMHNVDISIARIFNTYGPKMRHDDGRVVTNFIWQALHNENITVHGDGSQTRSLCYVDDTIDGLLRLMNKRYNITPVNIGKPQEMTILELANLIKEMTSSKSEIEVKEWMGQHGPQRRKPDIKVAKLVLEWEPKTSLEDGLQRTIEYFRSLM